MKKGNQEIPDEFLRMFLPNQKRILAYILHYIPNRADADDVFQDISSILWKKFDRFQFGTDFVAWSVAIARFEIMGYFKQKKREGKIHFDEELQKIIESDLKIADNQFDERIEALRECLKKLIPDDVHLIQMRYEQELSFSRIANRLRISSPAVFKKVSKIHSCLIKCIRLRIAFGEEA